MALFYHSFADPAPDELQLDEDSSRHIAQVLRMQAGDALQLTNGRGSLLEVELQEAHKKHCRVRILKRQNYPPASRRLTLAVALVKNAARYEWLLEKATEMGLYRIVPLLTQRTVREKFRRERMEGILVSAMLQSQQVWLPELRDPCSFEEFFEQDFIHSHSTCYIAHCQPGNRQLWLQASPKKVEEKIILIGPEGDFTEEEISMALAKGAIPVTLGANRLRTETAALAAMAGFYLQGE